MKPHRIIKSFPGSQTGNDHHFFEQGTVRLLSDDLAAIVVKAGWAEPHEDRDTKVIEPEEIKGDSKKKRKA
jgi:hypothetical protein